MWGGPPGPQPTSTSALLINMSTRLHLRTPAKINLDLRVLHKRPDNFHELRTVFQTISLSDTLEIEYTPSPRTHLELDDPQSIPNNLVLRAAHAHPRRPKNPRQHPLPPAQKNPHGRRPRRRIQQRRRRPPSHPSPSEPPPPPRPPS